MDESPQETNSDQVDFRFVRDGEKATELILELIKSDLAEPKHEIPGPFSYQGKLYMPTNLWRIKDLKVSEPLELLISFVLVWATEDGMSTTNPLPNPGRLESFGPNYTFPYQLTWEFWLGENAPIKPGMNHIKLDHYGAIATLLHMLTERLPRLEWVSKTDPFLA